MKRAAIMMHDLMRSLGIAKARVVGHDIGLMVACAYAALSVRGGKTGGVGCISPGCAGLGADLLTHPTIGTFGATGRRRFL
jgi:pimeloyl-ACP methyl ester carboxylesterase